MSTSGKSSTENLTREILLGTEVDGLYRRGYIGDNGESAGNQVDNEM